MKIKSASINIKTQLTLMMASVIVLSLILVGSYFGLNIAKNIEQNIINLAIQRAQIIGSEAIEDIRAVDDATANKVISQYSSTDSVRVAAILLSNHALLGFYSRQADMPLPQMDVSKRISYAGDYLLIAEPIMHEDEIIGYVYVEHDLALLFDSQNSFVGVLIAIGGLMIIFSFLMSAQLQKLITSPIARMVNHLDRIYGSKGWSERLELGRDDQLKQLVIGFNRILDAAQKREKNLTARAKQLKKLVEVRTKQLFQKAHYDALTRLPNRYLLVDRLDQAISKSSRTNSVIVILYLDLDRFKIINDNFGHQNGDLLLKEVAKRLLETARDGDTVARLGGDEFVFLLENINSAKDAARTALRIIGCFAAPFKLGEHSLHISTSIGISVYPDDGLDGKILLKNADISMYHAKKKGPGNFSYYSEEMNNASLERLAIESNLRKAIENSELTLVYQPQKRLSENRYRNAEALLRWNNDELGFVSPGVFIPIAEESGLIKEIDLWVISEVCLQIKKWNEQGLLELTVAVNVSAGHLISASLLEHLKTEIIVNQIKAEQIEIEITEEVFVEQTQRTIDNLTAIKRLGAKIAIDDFGTGYSSLQYIQDFPADTLKLDGMFIRNLETDKASQGIVRSTIILAHSLGLELVAECVEDAWQLDFLQENGCDIIQGYFLAKPLPPEEIPAMYHSHENTE